LRLAVVRLLEDFRAVVRFLGLRAAVVRLRAVDFLLFVRFRAPVVLLRAVDFRAVPFRFRVAAALRPARDLAALFRFRVAAAFLAAVERFRDDVFRAEDLRVVRLRDVDFFRAVAMGHLLSTLRTPCASGVVVPARSCLPTLRTARRGAGRS
jgi:cytochrome c biogenesis protein CcdA